MEGQEFQNNDKYRAHLIEAYFQKSGSFRKVFGLLLGFAAAFAFLIAWPYLSALHQERNLTHEITNINIELEQLSERHKLYQVPEKGIEKLNRMVENGPGMLRFYIESINMDEPFIYPSDNSTCDHLTDSQPAQMQGQMPFQFSNAPYVMQMRNSTPNGNGRPRAKQDICDAKDARERAACRIDRFVQYQLCGYEQFFKNSVLPSLSQLAAEGRPLFDQDELDRQFAEVRGALHKHITADPTFWYTVEGKGQMGVRLKKEVEQLWAGLSDKIEPVAKELSERMKVARERKQELRDGEKQLAKQREVLQARLAEIQSPIGNLPIGLTESVLLFPILLAIGFVMTTSSFLEQVRLRSSLLQAESGGGTSIDVLSSRELAQVAPLWIEPEGDGALWRWTLLLIPLAVFLVTVAAIVFHEVGAEETLFRGAGIVAGVYWVLYVISSGILLFCLQRIRSALAVLGLG